MEASRPVSPVSLNQLPQPYDISAAVQQALRLNSVEAAAYASNSRIKSCTQISEDQSNWHCLDNEDIEELLPQLDLLEDVWSNVTLPDIEKDSDNSANMEELERFCKYIDGEERQEETSLHVNEAEMKNEEVVNSGHTCKKGARKMASTCTCMSRYSVLLENSDLWEQFAKNGTEMVITKNGRRMFPAITVSLDNLNPDSIYSIFLDILPADDRRYKFMQTEWLPVGKVDKKFNYRSYLHPESPNSGTYWMEKPVSFKFLKLTNNKSTIYRDQVILNSMQKYLPTIRIVCESTRTSQTFQFPETCFIAVTAYQNSKITQLKIDNNPYARAFRDTIQSEGSNHGAGKKGGHIRIPSKQTSPHPLIRHMYIPSPVVCTSIGSSTCSATSIESVFDSSSTEIFNWISAGPINDMQQVENPYGCPLNYWADENSLYNSALIYPPPMIEPGSSFSAPYLQQTSQMYLDSQKTISPIKLSHDIHQTHYYTEPQRYTPVKPSFVNSHEDNVSV